MTGVDEVGGALGWRPEGLRLGRLVLVPVGELDIRAAAAVEEAWRIGGRERRALHVVTSEAAANELAAAWMAHDLAFPLSFVESGGGIAATVASIVELELACGFDEVVVVAGRLALRRRIHRLLHDRTAEAIDRAVRGIPAVSVGLLTVAST